MTIMGDFCGNSVGDYIGKHLTSNSGAVVDDYFILFIITQVRGLI